jgi:hypothetical protein
MRKVVGIIGVSPFLFAARVRNNWIMTPFETAIFIGTTAVMIGGFLAVGFG